MQFAMTLLDRSRRSFLKFRKKARQSFCFLYSCNQRGDNIAVFQVNRKTGGLKSTGRYTPVGNPSIIVFLDLTKTG